MKSLLENNFKISSLSNDPELISDLESFVINTKEEIAKSGSQELFHH